MENTNRPLQTIIRLAKEEVAGSATGAGWTPIVFAGRSRRMAVESLSTELKVVIASTGSSINSSVSKTLGDVGAALIAAGVEASLLVVQAAGSAV